MAVQLLPAFNTRQGWGCSEDQVHMRKTWLPRPPSNPHWSHKRWTDTGVTRQSHCWRFEEERASVCRRAQQIGHSIMEALLNLSDLFPCRLPDWEQKEGWNSEGLALSRFDRTQGEAGALTQPLERSALPCLSPLVALPPQAPKLTDLSAWIRCYLASQTLRGRHLQVPYCLIFFSLFFLSLWHWPNFSC